MVVSLMQIPPWLQESRVPAATGPPTRNDGWLARARLGSSRKTDLYVGKVNSGPLGFDHDPWIALRAACSMNFIASR